MKIDHKAMFQKIKEEMAAETLEERIIWMNEFNKTLPLEYQLSLKEPPFEGIRLIKDIDFETNN